MIKKITFDIDVCEKEGLTTNEFLYLISLYFNEPLQCIKEFKSLVQKCLVTYWGYDENNPEKVELTREGVQKVESVILNSEFKEGTKQGDRLTNLAKQLQELYPNGKKGGTQYYWRDSTNVIAKKLKAVIKKYGDCFTDEQAIDATKRYVASFNGNYQFMQLLKYFICKNVVKGGEVEEQSQLLSYIENAGQSDNAQQEIDWETELR